MDREDGRDGDEARGRAASNNVHFMEHDGDSVYLMDGSDVEDETRKEGRRAGDDMRESTETGLLSPGASLGTHGHLKTKLDFNAVDSAYQARLEEEGAASLA